MRWQVNKSIGRRVAIQQQGSIRQTSLDAFKELNESGKLGMQEQVIYDKLAQHGEPLTLQEISRATGISINAVSGRVNGLKKKQLLQECAKRKCLLTQRNVTPVGITGRIQHG
jgi:DNA-binding MarR family transcriptional regulator